MKAQLTQELNGYLKDWQDFQGEMLPKLNEMLEEKGFQMLTKVRKEVN